MKREVTSVERSEDGGDKRQKGMVTRHTAKGLVAASLAIAVVAVLAPAAWAHNANATISCTKVKYAFADFPAEPGNTVRETVYLNGLRDKTDTFVFNGPTGHNWIKIAVSGAGNVEAVAKWDTNGAKGSYEVSQLVTGCIIN
jgi:hypothetical protein